MLCAEVGRRQTHRNLHPDGVRCIPSGGLNPPGDGKQGKDEKTLILRLVLTLRDALVGNLIIPPSVFEHILTKGQNIALQQACVKGAPSGNLTDLLPWSIEIIIG